SAWLSPAALSYSIVGEILQRVHDRSDCVVSNLATAANAPNPNSAPPTPPTWVSIVANSSLKLQIIDILTDEIAGGVLRIPKLVFQEGMTRMKAALAAQFLGDVP
ncbi:hypothetical protein LINGRAHAP2_LOCUS1818, partial [Linum grandiflorum]